MLPLLVVIKSQLIIKFKWVYLNTKSSPHRAQYLIFSLVNLSFNSLRAAEIHRQKTVYLVRLP